MQTLLQKTITQSELSSFAEEVIKILAESEPFFLGYDADVGVGKTTLTAQLLYALGLNSREPVMSPTFAYVNEYVINDKLYAHLDLYRIEGDCDLTEILGRSTDEYAGLFVEWPRKVNSDDIDWTHRISGTFINETTRTFTLTNW